MGEIFGQTLSELLDTRKIPRGEYAKAVGTTAPQLSKYTGGKLCERAMLPRLVDALPDAQAKAELITSWLRDQITGMNGASGIQITAPRLKEEPCEEFPDMDKELRRALCFLANKAVGASELRELLLDLEKVIRGNH